jgi:hypothetical protein
MSKNEKTSSPSFSTLMFADLTGFIFGVFPGMFTWLVSLKFLYEVYLLGYLLIGIILLPLVLMASFLTICFLMQRSIPKMKPGLYRPGLSKGMIVWHLNNALSNSVDISGLRPLFYNFHIAKVLLWRALGANVDFGIISSNLLVLREYPLITLKKGCSFGAYVHISCHNFEDGKLFLAPIEIGENTFVGMGSVVGPKTKIGKNAKVGAYNKLYLDKIEDDGVLDNFSYQYGNPSRNYNKTTENNPKHLS